MAGALCFVVAALYRRIVRGAPPSELRRLAREEGLPPDGQPALLPASGYEQLLQACAETYASEGEQQLQIALRHAAMGMVILDPDWKILSANQRAAEMTGYAVDELEGMSKLSLAGPEQREAMIRDLRKVSENGIPSYRAERRLLRKDLSPVWVRSYVSRLEADGEGHILVLSEDITAEVAAREKLAWQAAHDSLTGLASRGRVEETLQNAILRIDLEGPEVAVFCLDLDGFRLINDTLGNSAADELLQQVAARLRGGLDETDFAGRIGGDKFALIMLEADGTEGPLRRAERLLALFAAPFRVRGSEIAVSASVGISRYPVDGLDADTLLQGAGAAIRDARHAGHNHWSFCTPRLKDDACERLLLANRLRNAVENNEMYVEYQPQYELEGNRLVGFEALCRWRGPMLGEVTPSRFIPAAEESGLIVPIGQMVLREACRRAVTWQTGLVPVRVAVNVSAVQFERADFVESVLATVRDSGLNPRLLELELTESTLVRDRDEGAKKMEELRAFGIRIAIDDFGTGYSSLSYLQNMPVDTLKVDRAFTARLSTSATAVTMVRAIIAMARALGLRIVTEGVETEEQAEILRQLGSDEVQGYLYGYPESAQSAAERVWRELVPAAILTRQGRSLALLVGAVGKQSRESVTGVIMPHSVQ